MRLTELDPRWYGVGVVGLKIGLTFLCPHCGKERLGVQFDPPIDPDGWMPRITPPWDTTKPKWNRSGGDSFDELTLHPSVDASPVGHWHGFIKNGQIVGGI